MQCNVFVPLFWRNVWTHYITWCRSQKTHLSNTRCGNLPTYTAFSLLIYLCTFSFLTLSFPVLFSADPKNLIAAADGLLTPLPEFSFLPKFLLWASSYEERCLVQIFVFSRVNYIKITLSLTHSFWCKYI